MKMDPKARARIEEVCIKANGRIRLKSRRINPRHLITEILEVAEDMARDFDRSMWPSFIGEHWHYGGRKVRWVRATVWPIPTGEILVNILQCRGSYYHQLRPHRRDPPPHETFIYLLPRGDTVILSPASEEARTLAQALGGTT
jgi:hypothetical protein